MEEDHLNITIVTALLLILGIKMEICSDIDTMYLRSITGDGKDLIVKQDRYKPVSRLL